jgi:hypothetical protein
MTAQMKSSVARRADLKAAIKRFRKDETITLEDLARLWGVSKARFINIRSDIAEFPDPVGKQGNAILYEAKGALECLLRHETRNDNATARPIVEGRADPRRRQGRRGRTTRCRRAKCWRWPAPAPSVDKRMREQGVLVRSPTSSRSRRRSSARSAARFRNCPTSSTRTAACRARPRLVDGGGKELLLRCYNRLNDMLGGMLTSTFIQQRQIENDLIALGELAFVQSARRKRSPRARGNPAR